MMLLLKSILKSMLKITQNELHIFLVWPDYFFYLQFNTVYKTLKFLTRTLKRLLKGFIKGFIMKTKIELEISLINKNKRYH